ncbi:MAG: hypothetical protein ABI895_41690, partial [Deltaproteobacteria bacterium]
RGFPPSWNSKGGPILYQSFLEDASLPGILRGIDEDLARIARDAGCGCRGALHVSNYPRKPRGPWALPEGCDVRLSFTCAECRKRTTPPSALFLGRRVYLAVVVALVSALRQGPTPARMAVLKKHWGVPAQTVARWQKWWGDAFTRSPFWRQARARFAQPLDEAAMPFSLVGAFGVEGGAIDRLRALLNLLSPITTRPWLLAQAS